MTIVDAGVGNMVNVLYFVVHDVVVLELRTNVVLLVEHGVVLLMVEHGVVDFVELVEHVVLGFVLAEHEVGVALD